MFRTADLILLNKIDLPAHVEFDPATCLAAARRANPNVQTLDISATRGDGLRTWYDWIRTARGLLVFHG